MHIDPVGVEQSPLHAIVVRGTAAKADSGVVVDEVLQNAYLYRGCDKFVLRSSFATRSHKKYRSESRLWCVAFLALYLFRYVYDARVDDRAGSAVRANDC